MPSHAFWWITCSHESAFGEGPTTKPVYLPGRRKWVLKILSFQLAMRFNYRFTWRKERLRGVILNRIISYVNVQNIFYSKFEKVWWTLFISEEFFLWILYNLGLEILNFHTLNFPKYVLPKIWQNLRHFFVINRIKSLHSRINLFLEFYIALGPKISTSPTWTRSKIYFTKNSTKFGTYFLVVIILKFDTERKIFL